MATKEDVIEAIKKVIDPELFIDIWTLGLIYDIDIQESKLNIKMTFTSMGCPAGPQLVGQVKAETENLSDIDETNVDIVFDPPWEPSEDLKALMGLA